MPIDKPLRFKPQELAAISSPYLAEGRKAESWRIKEVEIQDDKLTAAVSMDSVYRSHTDDQGFHLSFITAMEFVSQLQIIYMHVWAGLHEKTREVWMIETRMETIRPIRNPGKISIEMQLEKIRKKGLGYYCIARHRVTDEQGGLFKIWIKALMS